MACGCKKTNIIKARPKSTLTSSGNFSNTQQVPIDTSTEQLVQVEYMGPNIGNFSIRSRVYPNKIYRFGNNIHSKVRTVYLRDAEHLIAQVDRDNRPLYRQITGGAIEHNDPTAVLGRALAT